MSDLHQSDLEIKSSTGQFGVSAANREQRIKATNGLAQRLRSLQWVFLALSSLLLLVACGGVRREELQVSLEQARQAAEAELTQKANTGVPVWNGASLGEQCAFYDLRGMPSAYMFICEKEGQAVGYITVSASKRFTPIFEGSTSDTPPIDRLDEARSLAQGHTTKAIVAEQLVFLGGLSYYVKYTTQEEQQIFVDLSFPALRIESEQAVERMQRSFDRSSARNAEEAWNAVLTPAKP